MARQAKQAKNRRQEVRRQRAERTPSLWRRFRNARATLPVLIAAGFLVLASGLILYGGEAMPYRPGQRISQDIPARVSFTVVDLRETERRRASARRSSPNVFELNTALIEQIRANLNSVLKMAKEASGDFNKFRSAADRSVWKDLDAEDFACLKDLTTEAGSREFKRWVDRLLTRIIERPIVDALDPSHREQPPPALLRAPGLPERRMDIGLLHLPSPEYVQQVAKQVVWEFPEPLQADIARMIVGAMLDPDPDEPVYRFDKAATERLLAEADKSVAPVVVPYERGQPIVRAYAKERPLSQTGILTDEDIKLLEKEHEAYRRAVREDPALYRQYILSRLGVGGVVLLIVVGLGLYTARYRQRVLRNPARVLAMACLLAATLAAARLLALAGWPPELVVGAVVMAAAILTIAYDQRYALGVSGALVVLVTLALERDFGLFITMMAAMSLTVFMLKDIRSRSKLIAVGAATAAVAFVAYFSAALIAKQELGYVFRHGGFAALSGILAGFILQGILPFIERAFRIATSMTLLEWCDANRPLLKRLAQEAPGTYNHSLVIGSMAEAAADAIGANGLLTRVGAYYHDIGKIHKPEYFVENQEAGMNVHDRLEPTMSLMVIRGHVKDGVEIAKEYGLPRVLLPFIEEHHGTTVVRYFHQLASERQKVRGKHDREVSESQFRYAGPKPASKETAVLMLADAAEGAVRSLQEPTPGRIESTVHQVLMERLNDGQFDDCDITLKELHRVEESLVKSICRFYHGRVAYPKPPASQPEPQPVPTAASS